MRRHGNFSPPPLEQGQEKTSPDAVANGGDSTGVTTRDCEEHINDWESFNCLGVQAATKRLRRWSKLSCLITSPVLALLHMHRNGFAFRYLAVNVVSGLLLALCAEMTHKLAHTLDKSRATLVGYLGQLVVFAGMVHLQASLSLDAPGELMQHRIFLTFSLPIFVAGPYAFHMPTRVFALAYCPIWLSSWLFFHYLVGFLNLTLVIYAFSCCSVVTYMHHMAIQQRWQHFQTTCALEAERELLIATQKALHGMLSSLWDASCTCDAHGQISTSTPHLEQLLGAAEDLGGSNLCAFAANAVDAERLQEFLRNAASSAEHQALSLQCALQQQEQKDASVSKVYEVALYGIKLPPSATHSSSCSDEHSDRLFIGIKAGAPEATIGDFIEAGTAEAIDHAFTDDFISPVGVESARSTRSTSQPSALDTLSLSGSEPVLSGFSQCSTSVRSCHTGKMVMRSSGAQTEQPSMRSQCVQTGGLTSQRFPPRVPGHLESPRGRPAPRFRPALHSPQAPSSNSSGSRSSSDAQWPARQSNSGSESSCESYGSSGESYDIDNCSLSSDEDAVIVMGGGDEQHSWLKDCHGVWQTLPSLTGILRLTDFCALPRDADGRRTSFGSLAHLVRNEHCKRCVFHRKSGGKCNAGALCFYCHGDHERPPRISRKPPPPARAPAA